MAVSPPQGSLLYWLAVVARDATSGARYQMMRSLDAGQSWHPTGGEWGADDAPGALTFSLAVPGRVYLATTRGLWLSEDLGSTWSDVTPYATTSSASPRVRWSVVVLHRPELVEVCFLATDTGLWRMTRPVPGWDDD